MPAIKRKTLSGPRATGFRGTRGFGERREILSTTTDQFLSPFQKEEIFVSET
jgi:hypothetical protein